MSETLEAPPIVAPDKEAPEAALKRSKGPPKDGPCKGCGQAKPINRLMLCYPCWVKAELLRRAREDGTDWLPGDPHPAWCACALPEHGGQSRGN